MRFFQSVIFAMVSPLLHATSVARRALIATTATTAVTVAALPTTAWAQPTPAPGSPVFGGAFEDQIDLRSGSEIEVRVIDETETENRKFVVFETSSGSIVKLDRKLIDSVLTTDEAHQRYRQLRDRMPKTVEANWEIIDWCKSQSRGRTKFKDEIQYHLENIIEIEPNQRKARQLLGYEDFNGQWSLKELRYRKYGYVKGKSNWVPELALQMEKNSQRQQAQEGALREQFSKWNLEIRRGRLSVPELERALFDIVTPESADFVFEQGGKEKDQPVVLRKMFVEAFGRAPSLTAAGALVYFVITDVDLEVRERAVTLLLQPEFDQDFAMRRMASFLDSKNQVYSERAAIAIRELSRVPGANPRAVLRPLIDSLVAVREVPIPGATGAGRLNTSFSNNGGLGFSTGGGPQTTKKQVTNASSLSALRLITGENFGYNESLWENYFVDNFTVSGDGVRGDQ